MVRHIISLLYDAAMHYRCITQYSHIHAHALAMIHNVTQEKRRVNTDPFLYRIYTIGLYML